MTKVPSCTNKTRRIQAGRAAIVIAASTLICVSITDASAPPSTDRARELMVAHAQSAPDEQAARIAALKELLGLRTTTPDALVVFADANQLDFFTNIIVAGTPEERTMVAGELARVAHYLPPDEGRTRLFHVFSDIVAGEQQNIELLESALSGLAGDMRRSLPVQAISLTPEALSRIERLIVSPSQELGEAWHVWLRKSNDDLAAFVFRSRAAAAMARHKSISEMLGIRPRLDAEGSAALARAMLEALLEGSPRPEGTGKLRVSSRATGDLLTPSTLEWIAAVVNSWPPHRARKMFEGFPMFLTFAAADGSAPASLRLAAIDTYLSIANKWEISQDALTAMRELRHTVEALPPNAP